MTCGVPRGAPISVVVPTLDEADRILGLLAALCPQLAPRDEVIVVDGGSTDGTPGLVRDSGLPQIRVIDAQRGRGVQLRMGAEAARGERLLFLHADTRPGPLWFSERRTRTPAAGDPRRSR